MSKEVHVVGKEAAILCQSITWLEGGWEEKEGVPVAMEKGHNFTEESQSVFWLAAYICFNSFSLSYTTEQPQV